MVHQTQDQHEPAHQDRTNFIVYLVTVALPKGSKWQTAGVKAQDWVDTGWTLRVLELAYALTNHLD